jgi:hypothetical protein
VIRELLAEADSAFSDSSLPLPKDWTIDLAFLVARNAGVARELYGGYHNESDLVYARGGYVRQVHYFENKDQVSIFAITEDKRPHRSTSRAISTSGPRVQPTAGRPNRLKTSWPWSTRPPR